MILLHKLIELRTQGRKMCAFLSVLTAAMIFSVSALGDGKGSILTDSRDNKKYRVVKIGDKQWMAENLNFKTDNSWCYGNDESNCKKYGRLYNWDAAMKACPAGWRVPAREEWNSLITHSGDHGEASRKLKTKTGWRDDINGTDEFGFSAMPTGHRNAAGTFRDMGSGGFWWSATEYESGKAWSKLIGWVFGVVDEYSDNKAYGFSVRCVQDVSPASPSSK